MPARHRLVRLEVTAWRGVRDTVAIPLDQPLNILYGPNGAGKSSLLTAIEWALFPRETTRISEHRIGERREWEIRHVHGGAEPEVRLQLSGLAIERRGLRDLTPAPVRAQYADFTGLVFLHQETLRDFLVGTAGARQAAFQRLLGAGWARDLAAVFEGAARKLDADAADTRVDRLEHDLHVRLLEARRQLDGLAAEARRAGLEAPWRETSRRAAAELEELRRATPPALRGEAAARRARLEARRDAWLSARDAAARDAELAAQSGALERIQAALDAALAERQLLRASLQALDRHTALLRDALHHVRDHPNLPECPVCRQTVSGGALAAELDARLKQTLDAEAAELSARLAAAEAAIGQADRARAEAARLHGIATRSARTLEQARGDLETAFGRAIEAAEDPAALIARELARLEADLVREQQAAEAAQSRVVELDRATTRASLARRAAEQEERIAKLESLRATPAWAALHESQRRIALRELLLQHAAAAVKAQATELAAANLERARKPIGYIYSKLTQRRDFPHVAIDPAEKFEVGVASSAAGAPGATAATGILNLTDLNCLALAVSAGMAVAFPEAHDLAFLVLDDPSQGMDPAVTARLAPILAQLAKKLQIVVATPDAALMEALRAQPVFKNVITLEPRDPRDARPSVRVRSIER